MPDDENTGVVEEIAAPVIAEQQTENEPETQEAASEAAAPPEAPKNSKEDNLRQQGRVIEDQRRRIAELESAFVRMAPPKKEPEPEPDELANLDDEDFISVGQVKKIAQKIAKETYQKTMNEGRVDRLEESFKARNSDYDAVVNQDNFEKLFKDMPELKPVLAKAYEAAVRGENIDPVALSYKLLKPYMGEEDVIQKKAPGDDRLARNASKPISANAIKSSALTEAHKYMGGNAPSKEDKARIYKETVEAAKARR
jgi:hypothetical protein